MTLPFARVQRWVTLGMVVIVLGLVGQMLYRERAQLLAYPWRIQAPFLLLAFLGHACAIHLTFVVWGLLVGRLAGSANPGWRTHLSIYYPTALAKRIPGTVWYAAGRVVMYERAGVATALTLAALVLEMTLITIAGIIFFLLMLPLGGVGQGAALASLRAVPVWIPVALIVAALGLSWPGVLERLLNWGRARLGRPPVRLTVGYQDILLWLGLNLLVWLTAGVGFFGVVSIIYPAPWADLAPMMLIITLASLFSIVSFLVPVLPMVREATVSVLLAAYMPLSVAIVVAILYRVVWTLCDLFWAVVALRVTGTSLTNEIAEQT